MNKGLTQFDWQKLDELIAKANSVQVREMFERVQRNIKQRRSKGVVL